MIEARRLVKQFGAVTALAGLSVAVPEGRVGLLGPNGAGKSTFIKLALGIFSPTSGSVEVLGEQDQVLPLLSVSDVFLLPSAEETTAPPGPRSRTSDGSLVFLV